MQRQLLVLDSRYRINKEDQGGYEYKFKFNVTVRINDLLKLEQFIFQNSQYVFSKEKKTNKFMINNVPYTIEGTFNTIDAFVKKFNEVVNATTVRMLYTQHLYEIKIQTTDGQNFIFSEYYDDGIFMDLIGLVRVNTGTNVYTNTNIPKLFSQSVIYITLPELGVYNTYTQGSMPYTFLIASQPGFEIISSINNTFSNTFSVSNKEINEITVQIRDSDGLSFVNNKGNSNFIMILSY